MATRMETGTSADRSEERFFLMMAIMMSAIIVAGFALNLALGRSTFAVPAIYHVHAFVFFGWVVIYLAQNALIASGNRTMHRRLGWLAALWVPGMLVLGVTIIVISLRRTGGPFFFDQNEFLFSNPLLLVCFSGLVAAAIVLRRKTDWHRRLMLVSYSILTGPGLGRLLPMPLMIPNAWRIMMVITMIFPVIGMIADKRRHGRIHRAWLWGIAAVFLTQVLADAIAYSQWGIALTRDLLAATPGAMRPMAAFLPENF